jgi:hypothetical protein
MYHFFEPKDTPCILSVHVVHQQIAFQKIKLMLVPSAENPVKLFKVANQ